MIDRALQAHGGLGYSTDMPLEMLYRYARHARFVDGVRRLPVGPAVPHLTREFIEKCLDDLRSLGLIARTDADVDARGQRATVGAT